MVNDFLTQSILFLESPDKAKKSMKGKGVLTIINSKDHGKRIVLSKELEEDLDLTDKIQIAVSSDCKHILIGDPISPNACNYNLKRVKKNDPNSRLVLYNTDVVRELTEKLGLAFGDKVSVTFYGIEYIDVDEYTIAKISERSN